MKKTAYIDYVCSEAGKDAWGLNIFELHSAFCPKIKELYNITDPNLHWEVEDGGGRASD